MMLWLTCDLDFPDDVWIWLQDPAWNEDREEWDIPGSSPAWSLSVADAKDVFGVDIREGQKIGVQFHIVSSDSKR